MTAAISVSIIAVVLLPIPEPVVIEKRTITPLRRPELIVPGNGDSKYEECRAVRRGGIGSPDRTFEIGNFRMGGRHWSHHSPIAFRDNLARPADVEDQDCSGRRSQCDLGQETSALEPRLEL